MQHPDKKVVVVGAGLAGLATAVAAAQRGYQVTVLETAEKVGGAAAYSGGMVWVPANHVMKRAGLEDTLEEAAEYIESTGSDYPELLDIDAMHRWLSASGEAAEYFERIGAVTWRTIPTMPDYFYPEAVGSKADGRFLTAVFDGDELGDWRDKLHVSPHFPVGTTYDDIFTPDLSAQMGSVNNTNGEADEVSGYFSSNAATRTKSDLLTMGTGVVANFLAFAAKQPNIEILLNHSVERLLVEDGRVVGAAAKTADGTAEFRGSVVLTTSGYDWNSQQVKEFAELDAEDFGSVAPNTLRGDGMRLAQSAGGALVAFPGRCMPMLPGYPIDDGTDFRYSHEHAYPHSFMVDTTGRRFCDDSYYRDLCWKALDPNNRHIPVFLIWDEQHHRRYGGAGAQPGGEYAPDLVTSASTLRELGEKLGIDGAALEQTAAEFNKHAAAGEDPAFGRGTRDAVRLFSGDPTHELHPNVAPVSEAPYFGMRARFICAGIGMSGIRVDADGRVLNEAGAPVGGLFAAGAAAAFTASGTGYQSGYSLSRAITLAYTVAEQLDRGPW